MTNTEVIISEDAIVDIKRAVGFYEFQHSGLGNYFLDNIHADIESLQFYSGIHSKHFGYYRLLSKRFPYAIYYDLSKSFVRVIAVLDMRQNPTHIVADLIDR